MAQGTKGKDITGYLNLPDTLLSTLGSGMFTEDPAALLCERVYLSSNCLLSPNDVAVGRPLCVRK